MMKCLLLLGLVVGAWVNLVVAIAKNNVMGGGFKWSKVTKLFLDFMSDLEVKAELALKFYDLPYSPTPDYPYWNFLPQHLVSLKSSAPTAKWSAQCFQDNSAVFTKKDNATLNIEITSSNPTSSSCSDVYALATACTMDFMEEVKATAIKSKVVVTNIEIALPSDISNGEIWDIDYNGVRIFRHLHSKGTILSNVLATMRMFVPENVQHVSEEASKINIDFFEKYMGIYGIHAVPPSELYIPDESEVKSGDPFYLRRFGGMGALFSWAMGATTGHVTVALWIDGELYVVESAGSGAAWPVAGVQRTPYRQWIKQRIEADWTVVWAPLNEEARNAYNETAAVEYFKSVEGYDYGFQTVIWGWLDTAKGNFPCLPPDFSSNCWQWEFLEPLLAYADRLSPEVGDNIWNPGYNKRLGTTGLRTVELYQETAKQGMTPLDVIQIVEQDSWVYDTHRNGEAVVGPATVCCVFVCDTWKAAGVFGNLTDSINCAEVTNWDDYVLTIHADKYYQMVGEYSLELNNFRSKVPYAHMAERCPGLPIDYARPPDC